MNTALRLLTLVMLLTISVSPADSQWTQTPGVYGASVYTLTASNGTLFAGTNGAGMFRSTDSASTWAGISNGLTTTSILSLFFVDTTLFAGTEGGGVCRSTDKGASWTASNSGLTNLVVAAIAKCGTSLFAGTFGAGVFCSRDSGWSWSPSSIGIPDSNIMCLLAFADTSGAITLFAGTYGNGVYRSTDSGATWSSTGLTSEQVFSLVLVPVRPDSNILFAGMYDRGIYRSTNQGKTWTRVMTGLPDGHIRILAVMGNTLFAGSDRYGVSRSTNYGSTWQEINTGMGRVQTLGLIVDGSALYAGVSNSYGGSGGGVFRSLDSGATWTQMNAGLTNVAVQAIATGKGREGNTFLLCGTSGNGIFFSADSGTHWAHGATDQFGMYMSAFALRVDGDGATSIFGAGFGAYLSKDEGASWALQGPKPSFGTFNSIAVADSAIYTGTYSGGVFRTTDAGMNWVRMNVGLTSTSMEVLATSPPESSDHFLFAGTMNGLFRLPIGDTTWVRADSGITKKFICTLCFHGLSLYAGTYGGGVFRSTDNGNSWSATGVGLPDLHIRALALVPDFLGGPALFAGGWGGVSVSRDSGVTWTIVSTGLPNSGVYSLAVCGANLFAGTSGWGLWQRPLSEMVTPLVVDGLSTSVAVGSFALDQNYPNPFNPTTRISYQIPHASLVKLVVYDLLGRVVTVLVNERKTAGSYQVSFDGSGLASGVYFYQLHAGDFVQTKMLCLLK